MKISYKVLQDYIKNLKTPEEIAKDLINHTAEVEDIHSQSKDFENMVFGKIKSVDAHSNADALRVCKVDVGEEENLQIVCGGSNLEVGQGVAIAKIGASVSWHGGETITMKKTAIRGVDSYGMICAAEEIGLDKEFPQKDEKEILDLSFLNVSVGTNLAEVLGKDDDILEVDNKAINHRPDLFSHIGVIRELYAIRGEKFDFNYENRDFSSLKDLAIKNEIEDVVRRYIGVKVNDIKNIDTPEYIKKVLSSAGVDSKGLLVDLSNYSLYLYGQPTHMFDADKIKGKITIRYAKDGEKFLALDDKEYELTSEDIVIADDEGVIALGGVIGGKNSAITDETTSVVIEGAHFHQAIVRKTGKRLGIRTDSLNVFEKDLLPDMAHAGVSLIVSELEKNLPGIKLDSYSDIYKNKQETIKIAFDVDFINNLIGKKYDEKYALGILNNLGVEVKDGDVIIPFWRKDLNFKADLAEEIARIDGYNNIQATIPRVNLGAVKQSDIYNLKNDVRSYLTALGFYDMYNYSFVNEELMEKMQGTTDSLVPMKNALSDELTHMKGSLLPNLMLSLEKNIRSYKDLKLFEIEKVFKLNNDNTINESYNLSGVITSDKEIVYYDIQNIVSSILNKLGVDNFYYNIPKEVSGFAHKGRTADIIVRGKVVGQVGEIHPKVAKNFDLNSRVGFFEIDVSTLKGGLYNTTKVKEVSEFQENNFDINFVIDKDIKGKDIKVAIEKTDVNLIQRVELFDIYENEDKLPGQRSLSFKVFIQSLDGTLDDKVKNELISEIVKKVEKKGGILR